MTLIEWSTLALVCLMGAATPGPSLAIIARTTLESGLSSGRLASISHALAVGIYALGAVLGLAALFQLFPILAKTLMFVGAAYLIYLGIKLLMSPPSVQGESKESSQFQAQKDGIRQAFLIAFLNPKLAIFFFALFSQFIPPEGANFELTFILVTTVLTIDMVWYLVVVQAIDKVKHKVNMGGKTASFVKKLQGFVFIAIALNALAFHF